MRPMIPRLMIPAFMSSGLMISGLAIAGLSGCVDPYVGAIIHMNFNAQIPPNAAGSHYQLHFEVNGAAVPGARFKILDAVSQCGADQALVSVGLRVVQSYRLGLDQAAQCDDGRRLGQVDLTDLATGALIGGVRLDIGADLGEATAAFITVEADDDTDDRPADDYVVAAALGQGRDPDKLARLEATRDLCANDPEALGPGGCDEAALADPPIRRGVLLGSFLPLEGGPIWGEIAVVPAEDGATL